MRSGGVATVPWRARAAEEVLRNKARKPGAHGCCAPWPAAHQQLQLDVYGEVMDALYYGRCGRLDTNSAGWELQLELLRHLEAIWKEPDHGIWEVRGDPRQFTTSKVMAWVAFDRAVKTVEHSVWMDRSSGGA